MKEGRSTLYTICIIHTLYNHHEIILAHSVKKAKNSHIIQGSITSIVKSEVI